MSIVLDGIEKAYGEHAVFSGFSAVFHTGKTTAVMGASGSGKTTLLRLLMGFETPDGGTISGVPGRMSAVFQENRLCEAFTVEENIRAVLHTTVPEDEILNCLSRLKLEECMDQQVASLSGGMKRRVAIARALLAANEPEKGMESSDSLVLLDEPFQGLDGETKEQVLSCVKEMLSGMTVILVTHDKGEADALADEILDFGQESI